MGNSESKLYSAVAPFSELGSSEVNERNLSKKTPPIEPPSWHRVDNVEHLFTKDEPNYTYSQPKSKSTSNNSLNLTPPKPEPQTSTHGEKTVAVNNTRNTQVNFYSMT